MHDRGAGAQMRAQTQAVAVAHTHPGGNHIIHQARELIDMAHTQVPELTKPQRKFLKLAGEYRSVIRPRHVCQLAEQSVQVDAVRAYQRMRK